MKVRPLTNEKPVSVASSHWVKLRRSGGFAGPPLGGAVAPGAAATPVSSFAMLLLPSKVASAKGTDDRLRIVQEPIGTWQAVEARGRFTDRSGRFTERKCFCPALTIVVSDP